MHDTRLLDRDTQEQSRVMPVRRSGRSQSARLRGRNPRAHCVSIFPEHAAATGLLKIGHDGPVHVALLLWAGFDMHDLSALLDIFELANTMHDRSLFTWSVHGLETATVETSSGLSVQAGEIFSPDLQAENVLVLAGFDRQPSAISAVFAAWLSDRLQAGGRIGVIGGASSLFAQMGLLDGHCCAAHWAHIESYRQQHQQVEFRDQIYRMDQQILSCIGGCGTTDIALAFVREIGGLGISLQIADSLNRSLIRDQHDVQRPVGSVTESLTRNAVKLMREHVEMPLSSRDIARRLGTSVRRLQRCFKRDEKLTPTQFYIRERLLQARRLLWLDPSLSVATVAHRCGFISASDFARNFTRQFGYPPSHFC